MPNFYDAIFELEIETVKTLLEENKDLVNQACSEGKKDGYTQGSSPLAIIMIKIDQLAKQNRSIKAAIEVMDLLLKNGANSDIYHTDTKYEYQYIKHPAYAILYNITPLAIASHYPEKIRIQILDLLLEHADVNKKFYAIFGKDGNKHEVSLLALAALFGDKTLLQHLFSKKIEFNQMLATYFFNHKSQSFQYYTTAAGYAISSHFYQLIFKEPEVIRQNVIELFIENKINITIEKDGISLFTLSILFQRENIFLTLLARINKLDLEEKKDLLNLPVTIESIYKNFTPLFFAIFCNNPNMVLKLLFNKSDPFIIFPTELEIYDTSSSLFDTCTFYTTQTSALQKALEVKDSTIFKVVLSFMTKGDHKNKFVILANTVVEAIKKDKLSAVQEIIATVSPSNPDFINHFLVEGHSKNETYFGYSFLSVAVELGREKIVDYLVSQKADVNLPKCVGKLENYPPIFYLFDDRSGNRNSVLSIIFKTVDYSIPIIKTLLDAGADLWQQHPEFKIPLICILLIHYQQRPEKFIALLSDKKYLKKLLPDENAVNIFITALLFSEKFEIIEALRKTGQKISCEVIQIPLVYNKKTIFSALLPFWSNDQKPIKTIIAETAKYCEKTYNKYFLLEALKTYYLDLSDEVLSKFEKCLQQKMTLSNAASVTNNKILIDIFCAKIKKTNDFYKQPLEEEPIQKIAQHDSIYISLPQSHYLQYAQAQLEIINLYMATHADNSLLIEGIHFHLLRFMQAIVETSPEKNKIILKIRHRLMHGYENLDNKAYIALVDFSETILKQAEIDFDQTILDSIEKWLKAYPMPKAKDLDYGKIILKNKKTLLEKLDQLPSVDQKDYDFHISVIKSLLIHIGECQQQAKFEIPKAKMFLEAIKDLRDSAGHVFILDTNTSVTRDDLLNSDVIGVAALCQELEKELDLFLNKEPTTIFNLPNK